MSAAGPGDSGSGQPAPEQDPWARPADAGQAGSAGMPPSAWPGQPDADGGTWAQQPAENGFSPSAAEPWPGPTADYPATGQYEYQPAQYHPATRNNPFALAALVCGIGQFFLGLLILGNIVLAIPAVICGVIGLRQTEARGERGRGMAKAGLVLGILGVVYFIIVIVVLAEIGLHAKSS